MNLYFPTESPSADSAPTPVEEAQPAVAPAPSKTEGNLPTGYKDMGSVLGDLLLQQARLADEIEKLRRQMSQEDEFARFAKQSVQFIDAMDRMIASGKAHPGADEIKPWLQGWESAFHKMLKLMEKFGLNVISCDGQQVDLAKHDVVEYRETADYPHDTVVETALKGIVLRGKVLRDARVIVACNKLADAGVAGENPKQGQENG